MDNAGFLPVVMLPDALVSAYEYSIRALLIVAMSSLALLLIGLLWSPFGAAICAIVARTRGLRVGQSAWTGAKCAMLFLIPWLYLLVWLFTGRPAPRLIVFGGYVLLYGMWFCWIAVYVYAGFYTLFDWGIRGVFVLVPMLGVAVFNLSRLLRTLKRLRRIDATESIEGAESQSCILRDDYITPYVRFSVCTLVSLPFVTIWLILHLAEN